jgi:hypothetical protein
VAELTSVTAVAISGTVTATLTLPPIFCSTGGPSLLERSSCRCHWRQRQHDITSALRWPGIEALRQLQRERHRRITIARAGESIIRCGVNYRF